MIAGVGHHVGSSGEYRGRNGESGQEGSGGKTENLGGASSHQILPLDSSLTFLEKIWHRPIDG